MAAAAWQACQAASTVDVSKQTGELQSWCISRRHCLLAFRLDAKGSSHVRSYALRLLLLLLLGRLLLALLSLWSLGWLGWDRQWGHCHK